MKIKFTPKFYERLEEIADFIYLQSESKKITIGFILALKKHIIVSLTTFPKMGRPAEEFGKDIRKLVHQHYTILYQIQEKDILVLTIYKENLPSL